MKRIPIPKGVTCNCGQFTAFDSYTAAHWNEVLHGVCSNCGAKQRVYAGRLIFCGKPVRKVLSKSNYERIAK